MEFSILEKEKSLRIEQQLLDVQLGSRLSAKSQLYFSPTSYSSKTIIIHFGAGQKPSRSRYMTGQTVEAAVLGRA